MASSPHGSPSYNAIADNIRIDVEVTNKASGNVVDTCFDTENYANSFNVVSATLGTSEGSCSPAGTDTYLIANNKANFFCEFERSSDSSYASQLSFELEYLYNQETKQKIVVKDVTQGLE